MSDCDGWVMAGLVITAISLAPAVGIAPLLAVGAGYTLGHYVTGVWLKANEQDSEVSRRRDGRFRRPPRDY